MATNEEVGFPGGNPDERELLLDWLDYLRGAVMRKASGVDDRGAHWTPDGRLIPLVGIVNHLTHVEWRWIDGAMLGREVSRSEEEFRPGAALTIDAALLAYGERATVTNSAVRAMASLREPCRGDGDGDDGDGTDLRWVLLHLINETARHAGHADAIRELLDGATGE